MDCYILYICVRVQLNVYSPFDQAVSLPNVMVSTERGSGVHIVDLWIKATSVY